MTPGPGVGRRCQARFISRPGSTEGHLHASGTHSQLGRTFEAKARRGAPGRVRVGTRHWQELGSASTGGSNGAQLARRVRASGPRALGAARGGSPSPQHNERWPHWQAVAAPQRLSFRPRRPVCTPGPVQVRTYYLLVVGGPMLDYFGVLGSATIPHAATKITPNVLSSQPARTTVTSFDGDLATAHACARDFQCRRLLNSPSIFQAILPGGPIHFGRRQ